jgi:RNA polymerase sigma-70 factor (ECF subfamily)
MGHDSPKGFADGHTADRFTTTQWSIFSRLQDPSSPQAQQALAVLCEKYWYPIYAFIRYRGHPAHEAQDLTQGFLVHLLEDGRLQSVRRDRGRFRSFLMATITHFLSNEWDKTQAWKRGGRHQIVSLDEVLAERRFGAEPSGQVSPGAGFDRSWAATLVDMVMMQLRAESVRAGREDVFAALQPLLIDTEGANYAEAAAKIGMSEGALRVSATRMRQRFRELLRAEIAETVNSPSEVTDELKHLMTVWAASA